MMSAAMNICPFCEYQNREGVLICERCGRTRSIFATLPTRVIPDDESATKPRWQGTASFTVDTFVVMHIEGERQPVILALDKVTLLGRANAAADRYPDVDLTPYGAFEKGVSSQHCALERRDDHLIVTDLGSTNGTYVNGQRLDALSPVIVRDGAELRLGKLTLNIYFESSAVTPPRRDDPHGNVASV